MPKSDTGAQTKINTLANCNHDEDDRMKSNSKKITLKCRIVVHVRLLFFGIFSHLYDLTVRLFISTSVYSVRWQLRLMQGWR